MREYNNVFENIFNKYKFNPFDTQLSTEFFKFMVELNKNPEKILELISELNKLNRDKKTSSNQVDKKSPVYPVDFTRSDNGISHRLSNERIKEIVNELGKVDVPMNSFVAHRVGDTIVLKLRDDQGISYIVTSNFWYADEN